MNVHFSGRDTPLHEQESAYPTLPIGMIPLIHQAAPNATHAHKNTAATLSGRRHLGGPRGSSRLLQDALFAVEAFRARMQGNRQTLGGFLEPDVLGRRVGVGQARQIVVD